MRLKTLLYFYGRRLRTHPIQEALAGLGIAIGVALAFAVMVANGSIAGSASEIVRSVTGSADLQLTARDSRGFDERLLREARALPDVVRVAPLLEQRAVIAGEGGREVAVNLASLDRRLTALSGRLPANFVGGGLRLVRGMVVSRGTAVALGLPGAATRPFGRLPRVRLELRGRASAVTVAATLGPETIGPLADAPIAVMPLRRLQQLAGLEGRVTRVLVDAREGREQAVRDALEALARGRIDVVPADNETALLNRALEPSDQATGFFAGISVFLGYLLAFNAMLLTAPERRRVLAELRIQGFGPRQLILMTLVHAAILGIAASIAGIAGGLALVGLAFDESPSYLAPPFTLGSQLVVGIGPIVVGVAGGLATSFLAALPPLLDLRRARAVDAVFHAASAPGNTLGAPTRRALLACTLALLALTTALLLWVPSLAIVASALLALATVLAIPSILAAILRVGEALTARAERFGMLTMALLALRATTLRSLALAATGAVAVYGCVAIGGAREDLLRGIAQYTSDYVGTADIWIVNGKDNQATNDILPGAWIERVAAVPGVADVRAYRGGFLDIPGRRAWVIARPADDPAMLPASQLVDGDLAGATERMRAGGWIAVSEQIADERGVGVGDALTVPTPSGEIPFRIAATTTNLGWSPGALVLNGDDYRRAWRTEAPSALEVDLEPGAGAERTRAAIAEALGPDSGLRVQTAAARAEGIDASARQGLNRLGQISLLLLLAAVLAMAAAMGAAIWQRRGSLAALRIQSFTPRQLWRVVLLEASVVLAAGCLTGAIAGVYGQVGADRYLERTTGFPVAPELAGWQTIETFGVVVVAALIVVAIPGWFAARVPPHLGLQE